jgi:acryloyl-coenzyme A reductase
VIQQSARITEIGWDKDLALNGVDQDLPRPSGSQVLVEVEACGVCYRDCIDRDGRFAFIQVPVTPGHEAVGRVLAVGEAVEDWKVGDRVATMHRDFCGSCEACERGETSLCLGAAFVLGILVDGGYATHLMAPERCFFAVPEGLSGPEAAILHCTFGTAYRGINRFAQISEGTRVAITGANGGVGTAAVQIASRLGAHVTAIVRADRHGDYLRELGASEVIVDDGRSFHKQIAPVEFVMDCVGEPTFNSALRSLQVGGRIVAVGNVVPERVALNIGYIITRGLQIAGSSGATRADMAAVVAMHQQKPFRYEIETVGLADADAAQRRVRAGGLRGRLVIVPA